MWQWNKILKQDSNNDKKILQNKSIDQQALSKYETSNLLIVNCYYFDNKTAQIYTLFFNKKYNKTITIF